MNSERAIVKLVAASVKVSMAIPVFRFRVVPYTVEKGKS
jgi:hypothetical protein